MIALGHSPNLETRSLKPHTASWLRSFLNLSPSKLQSGRASCLERVISLEIDKQTAEKPADSFVKEIRAFLQAVAIGIDAFKKRANEISAILQPAFSQLSINLQKLPGRTRELQRNLAERGWYILPQMPFALAPLEKAFAAQAVDAIDNALSTFVEQNVDNTEASLCREFPDRAALLKEAFDCHREGKYAASITLLLTQADGIVIETLGKPFFSKERSSSDPRTRKLIEDLQLSMYAEMLLEPLMTRGGMSANEQELSQYPHSLHRHQILHGIDTTYPSKLNSLKVITLVGYLGGLAKKIIVQARQNSWTREVSGTSQ